MKKISLFFFFLVCAMVMFAQAPGKFSFQAVVRNESNQLVNNAQVGVRVSFLQGSASGNAIYVETHNATTNTNGLVTLEVGGGTAQVGAFTSIDWQNGPWFLKIETDPNGGSNYAIVSVQQLLSVPYALYAKEAGNGFSGDITDYMTPSTMPAVVSALSQAGVATQSDIPAVPTNVSAFYNDAGYITMAAIPEIPTVPTHLSSYTNDMGFISGYTETDPLFNAWDKDYNDLINKPVPFSGNYNDLVNLPTIPTVPTNVSAFNNDAGYLTHYNETDPQFNAWDKNYYDLTNRPTIPTVPTNVSAFNNDAGYLTHYNETDPQFNAWDKDYNDLTNKPVIPTVPTNVSAFTNDAGYLTGYTETDPQFNAWDKNYNDLTNKPVIPTVPTNVSAFTNDAGYITEAEVHEAANIPTNVSAFTNDAGYLTSYTEQQVLSISNDTLFLTGGSFVKLPAGFDGNYNSLTNKPEIPTVPENVSAFTNDAGYLTGYTESDPQFNAWDKDYNDLTNLPTIPTVPENVSAFTNDAGYITSAALPTVPENVSAFTNDAGYITSAALPTVPANVSAFTNDAGYITSAALPTVPANVGAFTNDAHYVNNTGCDSIQFCDIIARLNAMQAEIDALRAMMPADTTQPGPDTTETPDPVVPIDLMDTLSSFACPDMPKVNDFDGNEYNTVKIGNQCWLRENIRSAHYSNGVAIPLLESLEGLTALPAGRLYPDLSQAKFNKYGYLYTYETASFNHNINTVGPITGVCPAGWRMPTSADWDTLFNYLSQWDTLRCNNEASQVVKAICSRVDWAPSTTECAIGWNADNNNATGFSIKPAGYVENGPYGVYGQNVGLASGTAAYFYGDGVTKMFSADGATVTTETIGQMATLSNAAKRAASVRCIKHVHTMSTSNLLPGVVTTDSAVSSIYSTSVICGGNVLDLGSVPGSNSHGICYSTTPNPTTGSSVAGAGSGMGAFNVKLSGLTPSTTYYFRAYVTNARGTTYGAEWTFTTMEEGYEPDPTLPVVSTVSVTDVTSASAVFTGAVTDDGYADLTARGFCWGMYPSPTVDSTHSVDGSGLGTFSHSVAQLQDATTYYVRAYATNSVGTVYGEELTFTTDTAVADACGYLRVEDPDGNFYSTVLIGTQCWMKENLRTTHYADGEAISLSTATTNANPSYFYPGGNANNVAAYGLLYNWGAAMHGATYSTANPSGVQGICPDGWHLPSSAEFNTLISYVRSVPEYLCNNSTVNISKALADSLYWTTNTFTCGPGNNLADNNATGFSARPASVSNSSLRIGLDAWFLSSSATVATSGGGQQVIRPQMYRIYSQSASTAVNFVMYQPMPTQMNFGASVRCVKDSD